MSSNNSQSTDLYEILGLDPEATLTDIKRQFRRLSVKYHPDKIENDLHQTEKEKYLLIYEKISLAYTILSDVNTRRDYDQMYYMEKRNEDFASLKSNFKKKTEEKLNPSELKKQHEEIIAERHRALENSYRPRTLAEYTSEREAQMVFSEKQLENTKFDKNFEKKIIKKVEPMAVMPSSMEQFQSINDVGSMYADVDESLFDNFDFTIENINTNIKELNIDKSMKEYTQQTENLSKLTQEEFDNKGHLILDKIIIQK